MMEPAVVTHRPHTKLQHAWRTALSFLAWVSAREEFPRAVESSTEPLHRSIAQFARWLFAPDQLPLAEPRPAERTPSEGGLVRLFLSPDTLPEEPAQDTGRSAIGSLARWLLAPERLPTTESDSVENRPNVVKWLLASEPLPPPTDGTTAQKTQEA